MSDFYKAVLEGRANSWLLMLSQDYFGIHFFWKVKQVKKQMMDMLAARVVGSVTGQRDTTVRRVKMEVWILQNSGPVRFFAVYSVLQDT